MILTQHYLGCLSQASYLIGDGTSGRAVVVDPRRDVGVYLEEAAAEGLTIERVIETHVHADFVGGHLELAAAAGAVISYGAGADVAFPIEPLVDGQRLSLGEVTLEILATPGHTPESICIVVYERADDEIPYAVLTGDTLFVGDVGRPDLLASGGSDLSADTLARRLHHSLHGKLLNLPDATRVFPAHGAGSSCGKQLSAETSSTLGEQRRTNYALQPMDEDAFVAVVTEGQPVRPAYFDFDAATNRRLHALLDASAPPMLGIDEVLALAAAGAVLLDAREPADFAAGHLHGAVNITLQGRFAEWAGDVLSPERDIVLVGDPATALEARVRLGRVGYDRVVGQLDDPAGLLGARPELHQTSSRLTTGQLADLRGLEPDLQLLDVRGPAETTSGTIPSARKIPLPALTGSLRSLDRGAGLVVYCASGTRSQIAASVMREAGFTDVSDLLGGFTAWQASGLPVATDARAVPESDLGGLIVHHTRPLNCETALPTLNGSVVTPNALFYVRNHFDTPRLDPDTWRLDVHGLVEHPLQLTLRNLQQLRARTLLATLECAGNGRSTFDPPVPGEQWHHGAVSTAEWTGVPLVEVLGRAAPRPAAREAVFSGADHGIVEGRSGTIAFERSLTLDEIASAGALLAYAMNGDPLPVEHGFPVRLIVPGWYAVASVKWLTGIEVIGTRFEGFFQTDRYVYELERDGTTVREPVRHQRVRSLITEPADNVEVSAGELAIRGVAWSGVAPIERVEVRIGHGRWQAARLVGEPHPGSWQRWELLAHIPSREPVVVRVCATDRAGNAQRARPAWNRLGYGGNAIHAVPLRVR